MELAEPPAEAGAGDEAAPAPADEGGADQTRGIVQGEAEEHLLDELVHQRGRRRHGVVSFLARVLLAGLEGNRRDGEGINHEERSSVAIEVVAAAAAGGAENRRVPAHQIGLRWGTGHLVLLAGDGVPDHEGVP